MPRKIIFTLLALTLITLPATAQSVTSFNDGFGDHIYYQGYTNLTTGAEDLFQLWPTGGMNIDMTQLPVSSSSGNPAPFPVGRGGEKLSLASFVNSRGQHLYYVDPNSHIRHLLVFWNGSQNVITNDDLTKLTGIYFQNGPLTAFSNARGEHVYITRADGTIEHLFWNGTSEKSEDLNSKAVPPPGCAYPTGWPSSLASFSDGSTELLYYIGPSGDVCEFALYNGNEGSYNLTKMSGAIPAGDGGQLTGFSDANGQHVFYVGANQHVYWLNFSPSGKWMNVDLTAQFDGNPAASSFYVGNSLTSFSNALGEQVFYVDAKQHINQINLTKGAYLDLTAPFGGALATQNSWCGTPMANIPSDDKNSEDVFYIGANQHVWELHNWNGGTWSPYDLTYIYGGAQVPVCFVLG